MKFWLKTIENKGENVKFGDNYLVKFSIRNKEN